MAPIKSDGSKISPGGKREGAKRFIDLFCGDCYFYRVVPRGSDIWVVLEQAKKREFNLENQISLAL